MIRILEEEEEKEGGLRLTLFRYQRVQTYTGYGVFMPAIANV